MGLDLELGLYFTVIFIYYNVWCTDVSIAVCQPFVKRIYDDDDDDDDDANCTPYPNPNHNPNPNPKVVFDLRNKETWNSFSYVCAVRTFRNSD